MRRAHPGWGPRTILVWLDREGVSPLPGRTSVERCLIRHGLVTPQARKRKRSDYKRWERSRAMELWQMDIVGGVRIVDGREAKIVSGIDDHSRYVVSARVVARATARPVCDALTVSDGRPWGARADPDRQRQGVHGPVRAGSGAGVVRPDLSGQRDHAHLDGAAVADDDRQGGALAQDAAPRVPRRQGVRLDRRRPGAARRVGASLQPCAAAPVDRWGAADRTVQARRATRASRPSRSSRRA